MKSNFNRSQFMKSKWRETNKKVEIYSKISGEKVKDKRTFLSENNLLDNSIVTYEVSTQLNYQSSEGGLIIQPKTFTITAFRSHNIEKYIEQKTKSSLSSMRINGNSFNSGLQNAIEQKTKVDFKQIRGMEETKKDLSSEEYTQLLNGQFIVTAIDDEVIFSKGSGSKKYKAKQDLSEFL